MSSGVDFNMHNNWDQSLKNKNKTTAIEIGNRENLTKDMTESFTWSMENYHQQSPKEDPNQKNINLGSEST